MVIDLYSTSENYVWDDKSMYSKKYTCGYCGAIVSSESGMPLTETNGYGDQQQLHRYGIYICTNCHMPTLIFRDMQISGNRFGAPIKNVPEEVNSVYEEARSSYAANSYTGVVLLCRKLLMHIAVDLGADTNLRFIEYVNYLNEHHYAGARSNEWVDQIRQFGNQTNHEIRINTKEEAQRIIKFCEMILKLNYEYPAIASSDDNN